MRKLVTRRQAQLDAEEAASWHENPRAGVGLRFLDELDHVRKRVVAAPLQFPAIHTGIRRTLLNRFLYSVYFLAGDEEVEVITVLHQHRHPDTWRTSDPME